MMKYGDNDKLPRLTITLGKGQREALMVLATHNHTTLAFIVRYALDRFIEEHRQKQLHLEL
jgi:hypothetical protein